MFEKLGTITFISKGWLLGDTYSLCCIYLDSSRVLLKYDSFVATYICSENDMEINHYFIQQLKTFISLFNQNKKVNISLKQLISYYSTQSDKHTKHLHNFIISILPGDQVIYSFKNNGNFSYSKKHTYLISHDDYSEYFL